MVRSYVFMFRRNRAMLMLLTLLAAPVLFHLLTFRPPQYQSAAVIEVTFGTTADQVLGLQRSYEEPERRVATEAELVESPPVVELAAARLGRGGDRQEVARLLDQVEAAPRRATNYIEIKASAADPREAQALTQAFADSYLEYRLSLQQGNLTELQEALLGARASTAQGLPPGEDIDRLLNAVRLRLAVDAPGTTLLSPASLPDQPTNQLSPLTAGGIALLAGGLLAMGAVVLLELLRDSVRSADEAARMAGAPVLGVVRWSRQGRWGLKSSRSVRLLLARQMSEGSPVVLLASTGREAADCSLVGCALAAQWARLGHRVLLVTDDERALGSPMTDGASLFPSDIDGLRRCRATSGEGEVGVFDRADIPGLIRDLASDRDVVLIAVADLEALRPVDVAPFATMTLVVCALGRTRGRSLQKLASSLRGEGAAVPGVVLTDRSGRRRQHGAGSQPLQKSHPASTDEPSEDAAETISLPAEAPSPEPASSWHQLAGAVGPGADVALTGWPLAASVVVPTAPVRDPSVAVVSGDSVYCIDVGLEASSGPSALRELAVDGQRQDLRALWGDDLDRDPATERHQP